MFRLSTSFTHHKDELLVRVQSKNEEISKFLEKASHLSTSRTPRPPRPTRTQTKTLLTLQAEAMDVYETFQARLRCECTSDHSCGITVSRMDSGEDQDTQVHLRMLFVDGPFRTQIKIQVFPIPATGLKTATRTAPPESATDELEEVSSLKQQLSAKNRFLTLKKKSPKTIFALVASSIPTFGSLPLRRSLSEAKSSPEDSKRPSRIRWSTGTSKKYVHVFDCAVIVYNYSMQTTV